MTAVLDGVIASRVLRRQVPYRILLPAGYADSLKNYSTLFLLHGLFGSFENWTTLADVATFAEARKLIVVMPEGGDSWYTDAAAPGGDKYESYLVSEFIPYIDGNYRTICNRRGRGIAGQSMGGYGAMKFALKYSELFSFAGSMSGVLDAAEKTDEMPGAGWDDLGPSIMRVFGDAGSRTRTENDLLQMVRELARKRETDLPYLYFDCGLDDQFLPANQKFSDALYETTIDHVYHELPGNHDWVYWNERSRQLLRIAENMLAGPTGKLHAYY